MLDKGIDHRRCSFILYTCSYIGLVVIDTNNYELCNNHNPHILAILFPFFIIFVFLLNKYSILEVA